VVSIQCSNELDFSATNKMRMWQLSSKKKTEEETSNDQIPLDGRSDSTAVGEVRIERQFGAIAFSYPIASAVAVFWFRIISMKIVQRVTCDSRSNIGYFALCGLLIEHSWPLKPDLSLIRCKVCVMFCRIRVTVLLSNFCCIVIFTRNDATSFCARVDLRRLFDPWREMKLLLLLCRSTFP
jgi:hypothetical protein